MSPSREAPRRPAAVALALLITATAPSPSWASEAGASFYLLGSGGVGAALLPPLPGVFLDNTAVYYKGKSSGQRQFVVGGNLVAGLKAKLKADFVTLLWVPTTDFAGGTLALGAALPVGGPKVDVSAVLTGPRGRQVTIERKDSTFLIADPVLNAALGWNLGGDVHLAAAATVNVPLGHYREDELANLSFHRWVVDSSLALTWHDAKAGWDVSTKAGLTFNGENHYTDYNTGTEFHLEGAVEKIFSPGFALGVLGYHFHQVSGDSGAGAILGPFKGRVTALGGTTTYSFKIAHKIPASLRLNILKEFGARNRLEGTMIMLSFDMPLKVIMPAGRPK